MFENRLEGIEIMITKPEYSVVNTRTKKEITANFILAIRDSDELIYLGNADLETRYATIAAAIKAIDIYLTSKHLCKANSKAMITAEILKIIGEL